MTRYKNVYRRNGRKRKNTRRSSEKSFSTKVGDFQQSIGETSGSIGEIGGYFIAGIFALIAIIVIIVAFKTKEYAMLIGAAFLILMAVGIVLYSRWYNRFVHSSRQNAQVGGFMTELNWIQNMNNNQGNNFFGSPSFTAYSS